MADKDQPDDAPQLEMPSFSSLRRKKRGAAKSAPEPEPEAATPPEPEAATEREPEPEPEAATEREPQPEPEPVPEPVAQPEPLTRPVAEPATQPEPEPDREPAAPKRQRRPIPLPSLGGLTAALVTGAIVGALAVLLIWLATAGCSAVRGTTACGGGPGLLLLVATLVLLAYLGGWLLRGFGIPEPGSTSFLGLGVMAVVAMLFFIDAMFEWWMVIVVPVLAMGGYALSWWVTSKVVTEAEEPQPHDVR